MREPLYSPASLLASFLSNETESPELVLVTGESGSGKTTWCLELIRQARLAGLLPHGFVSPGVFENGQKVRIDLLEIQTDERRHFARPRAAPMPGWLTSLEATAWQFSASVLGWANQAFEKLEKGDLLVIDELGPLELLENQGLIGGLKLIDERRYRLSFVVVRPALLATAQARWPWGAALDVSQPILHPQGHTS